MTYPNATALVTTDWLERHLRDPGRDPAIAILDATYYLPVQGESGGAKFAESHIPGAAFFDIDAIADATSPLPHMLPDAADFAAAVGRLGIGNRHHVVVYDRFGLMSAARAWFEFRYFGHDRVSVLDGGLRKWRSEGREEEAGTPTPRPQRFVAKPLPRLARSLAEVRANIATRAEQLVDARSAPRFAGAEDEPWPGRRRGHIPGSLNLPYDSLLDPESRTFVDAATLARKFADSGVDLSKPVITSCGSGVTACVLAFALHLLGHESYAVYDGSWAEWGLPGDTLVEP